MIWLVTIYGVLWQGTSAPCVDASHTMNIEVDIQIDKLTTLYFMGMANSF